MRPRQRRWQTSRLTARSEDTPFFAVSVVKLLVMSICTCGFHEIYWFYQNWKRIQMREQRAIMPFARALFNVIFCYPCFKRIRDYEAQDNTRGALAPRDASLKLSRNGGNVRGIAANTDSRNP